MVWAAGEAPKTGSRLFSSLNLCTLALYPAKRSYNTKVLMLKFVLHIYQQLNETLLLTSPAPSPLPPPFCFFILVPVWFAQQQTNKQTNKPKDQRRVGNTAPSSPEINRTFRTNWSNTCWNTRSRPARQCRHGKTVHHPNKGR